MTDEQVERLLLEWKEANAQELTAASKKMTIEDRLRDAGITFRWSFTGASWRRESVQTTASLGDKNG